MSLEAALRLAGLGQLALAAASLALPRVLHWREETAALRPLIRQLFWIYAAYILGFHVAFGLLSSLRPEWLLDGSGLARAVTGFVAVYWGARLVLQFAYLDRTEALAVSWFRAAEAALVALFAALTVVYGTALASNVWR